MGRLLNDGKETKKAFDKRLFFENARFLLKESNLKLGELEKKAGREPGYMARLEKEGNTTDPSIEFIATVAEALGVSIDYLTRMSLADVTPDDDYKLRFLDKLKEDTISGKVSWHMQKRETLQDLLGYGKAAAAHKMLKFKDGKCEEVVLESASFGINTQFAGDCYYTEINGRELYILSLMNYPYTSDDVYQYAMELWVTEGYLNKDFVCGTNDIYQIKTAIKELYTIVGESLKKPSLNKNVMAFVDSYMNDN